MQILIQSLFNAPCYLLFSSSSDVSRVRVHTRVLIKGEVCM